MTAVGPPIAPIDIAVEGVLVAQGAELLYVDSLGFVPLREGLLAEEGVDFHLVDCWGLHYKDICYLALTEK